MIRLNLSFFPNLCLAGHMKGARSGHAVIFDGAQFLVIGGYYRKTENCDPNGKTVTCTEHKVVLDSQGIRKYCKKILNFS